MSVGDLHPAPSLEQAREHTVRRLCEHFAADDLKVEDFETRLDRAYEATTVQALETLLADLAVPPASPVPGTTPPVSSRSRRGLLLAVLGGSERSGEWVPPEHMFVVGTMGGACLDFRSARLPAGETVVTAIAVMGGVDVLVPPGVAVTTNGFCLFGGFEQLDQAPEAANADTPILRINGFALMGGVNVEARLPGETGRQARRRLRAERRRRLPPSDD
ncbi:MAG: DUF1707 domain-containing protein [Gemmatimonadota bacterium]